MNSFLLSSFSASILINLLSTTAIEAEDSLAILPFICWAAAYGYLQKYVIVPTHDSVAISVFQSVPCASYCQAKWDGCLVTICGAIRYPLEASWQISSVLLKKWRGGYMWWRNEGVLCDICFCYGTATEMRESYIRAVSNCVVIFLTARCLVSFRIDLWLIYQCITCHQDSKGFVVRCHADETFAAHCRHNQPTFCKIISVAASISKILVHTRIKPGLTYTWKL